MLVLIKQLDTDLDGGLHAEGRVSFLQVVVQGVSELFLDEIRP